MDVVWTPPGLSLRTQAVVSRRNNEEFRQAYPAAFDCDNLDGEPPSSEVLDYLARFRMEPGPEDESSADEQVSRERSSVGEGTGPPTSGG